MAKAKKEELPKEEIEPIVTVEPKSDSPTIEEPIAEEQPVINEVQEVPEKDEVLFLKRILHIQHSGGFGRHLDDIIYERIKLLKCQ